MNKFKNWIKLHQVAAFYILAFAITWGLEFSYDAVLSIAALVVILVDRMWQRLPSAHPAVYREPVMIKFEKNITDDILEVSHV